MASKQKSPSPKVNGRHFRAIARDEQGKSVRFDIHNVSSSQEAETELRFQVRNLKNVLLLVKA